MQSPHNHEQSMQMGPNISDSDKIRRHKHRQHCQTTSYEYCNAEQVPLYHGDNGDPPSSHNGSSISGNSEVSSAYTCFACGTDGHISQFCSQLQSLADHSPDNNILYPHDPPPLVSRDISEQSVQVSTNGHHVDKGTNPVVSHLLNLIEWEMGLEPTQR